MSEPNSPGESQRGAPRFFVGCEDDESEVLEGSIRTDMELYEDNEDTDSVKVKEKKSGKAEKMKSAASRWIIRNLQKIKRRVPNKNQLAQHVSL
ncbi:hypothetical protein AMECASPLE_028490 [Ameca splendens]|uniref:Uncharacterized protein n=1 Tax=Ameca splendens TaxID=208324 RepID=A0ABV0XIG9_9TELE